MELNWLYNGFYCGELCTPFIVEKDGDYYKTLSKKFSLVRTQAVKAGADEKSLNIIKKYKSKILEAVREYYNADVENCYHIIRNLIKDVGDDPFAVSGINNSHAFPVSTVKELQLFRCRTGNPLNAYSAKDMLHLPKTLRSKSGNYRFSIPGNPCMYLANSSYGCWIETGFPADIDFNVSPVLLDGKQKVFNLAVSVRDIYSQGKINERNVHTWLKLLMLTIATSFMVKEENRTFRSEYIISQSIMMGCKKCGYDGVVYYSKRVNNDKFALCAINVALFVNYDKSGYSELAGHIKIDDSFNYSIFKKLLPSLKFKNYELKSVATEYITNFSRFDRQYSYRETEFCQFDKFLFSTWRDKPNNK